METPDYKKYNFRELFEALESIRGDQYPQALAALEAEIRQRDSVPKAELEAAYFHLNHALYPQQREQLLASIREQGGFDTLAPEVVSDENRYKSGWRRFWALIFDSVLVRIVATAATVPFLTGKQDDLAALAAAGIGAQILTAFYFMFMHASCGQTVGKMITGVKIVKNENEQSIGLRHALLRELTPIVLIIIAIFLLPFSDIVVSSGREPVLKPPPLAVLASLLALLWGITELVTMLFSKKRRALHDLIAGTVVIRYLRSADKVARPNAAGDETASDPKMTADATQR